MTDEKRVGIIAVHHSTTPLAAITEISKDARLGANNMPAIEKAVIFDLRTGLGVEKSLHLQIEMSGLWQQRNHCGKALYSINRQPSSTRYEILRF